jgi:hypothetical protein
VPQSCATVGSPSYQRFWAVTGTHDTRGNDPDKYDHLPLFFGEVTNIIVT